MSNTHPASKNLLKKCIKLKNSYNIFIKKFIKNQSFEWEEWNLIEEEATAIDKLLSESTEELPIKVIINARRFTSYIITMSEYDWFLTQQYGPTKALLELDKLMSQIEDSISNKKEDTVEGAKLRYSFPQGYLKKDVTEVINLTYNEVLKDFEEGCYFSAIVICGKIIETVLSALYNEIFKTNSDMEKIGIYAIINKLKESKEYEFKGTIEEQLNIIRKHRNKAVHGNILIPTIDEARGVISLTRDVLQKACSKEIST